MRRCLAEAEVSASVSVNVQGILLSHLTRPHDVPPPPRILPCSPPLKCPIPLGVEREREGRGAWWLWVSEVCGR